MRLVCFHYKKISQKILNCIKFLCSKSSVLNVLVFCVAQLYVYYMLSVVWKFIYCEMWWSEYCVRTLCASAFSL